jgi:hypothetical protein
MPIPMTPGGDGALGETPSAPASAGAAPSAPQSAQPEPAARPALATALPAWDLMPPSHVLAFRRRA